MNGRPWRAWWAMTRFCLGHRGHRGFRFVRVDTAYGFWCDEHGVATLYTGARGMELEAQLEQAAQIVAELSIHKRGGQM